MTTTSVDHHRLACDALERSTPVLLAAMRNAPASVSPTRMRWTCAELAAHMYSTILEARKVVCGEPSIFDGVGLSAEIDDRLVEQVAERDMTKLAELTADATAAFLEAARSRSGSDPTAVPGATVATFPGLFVLDHHLHGGQFAETAGAAWNGRVADMHSPLRAVLTYVFDPEAAKDFRGSFSLRLKGVEPLRYAVADGRLELDPEGRIDCRLTADPQTFLRVGIGIVSQLRAAVTGKLIATGRKPWLGFALTKVFPPAPHGGLAN